MQYINLAATYVKMLYYNKINISEGININKSNKSKECMICHHWYILDDNYKYEVEVCNGCHDISMIAFELENIAMIHVKGIDFRYAIWNMARNDAITRFSNSELDDKRSL